MSISPFRKGQIFLGKKVDYFKRLSLGDPRYSLAVFGFKKHPESLPETAAISFKDEMEKSVKVYAKHAEFESLLESLKSLKEAEPVAMGGYNIILYYVDETESEVVHKVIGLHRGVEGDRIFIGLAKNVNNVLLEPNYGVYMPIALYESLTNVLKQAIELGKNLEKMIKTSK